MALTEKIIAIFELGAYIPILNVLLVIIFRHGTWRKQFGWIFLINFSSIRIVGAVLELLSISHPEHTSEVKTALILQAVGLAPLLVASLLLLKRVTDEAVKDIPSGFQSNGIEMNESVERLTQHGQDDINTNDPSSLPPQNPYTPSSKPYGSSRDSYRSFVIHLSHFPAAAATSLCAVGGVYSFSRNDSLHHRGHILMEVGVGIFAGILATLVALTILSAKDTHKLPRAERLIYYAVLAAIPFLAVRILWSILAVYTSLDGFSISDPKPDIQFSMAILMELMVAVIYCVVGIFVER